MQACLGHHTRRTWAREKTTGHIRVGKVGEGEACRELEEQWGATSPVSQFSLSVHLLEILAHSLLYVSSSLARLKKVLGLRMGKTRDI